MTTSTMRNLPSAESLAAPANPSNDPSATVGRFRRDHPFGQTRIFEIHAKLSQSQRTRAAEDFRNCKSGILLSSDVTARGMDFPNVTHVIQIGLPGSKETYIHRIGRTARAGKEGEGWLIVSELEAGEIRYRLKDLPLVPENSGFLQTSEVDMTRESQIPSSAALILRQVAEATKLVGREEKEKVYQAILGVYGWFPRKRELIQAMNNLTRYAYGMLEPPRIAPGLAQKLGISRIPGVNMGRGERREEGADGADPFGGPSRGRGGFGGDRGGDRGGRGGFSGDRGGRGGFGGDRGGRSFGGSRGGDRGDRGHFGENKREGGFGGDRRGGFGGRERRGEDNPFGGEERRSRY